ncbi:MAG: glyceraldehyde 3-phosphate dehydrogenase NAD-binding domain-containing protein, partial [Patescibacteria group bacterium]
MKTARVAINGLGRIGRAFLRQAITDEEIEIVAINDLGDAENLAYLLRYDTVYGRSGLVVTVGTKGKTLSINGKDIQVFSEKNPAKLPWKKLNIDIAVESTGVFETYEKAKAHLSAGAKKVVMTAPSKDDTGGETILVGINENKMKGVSVTSNASCTTNAASPLLAILSENPGVEKAILNTVHAYTATQSIVDGPAPRAFLPGGG